MEESMSVMFMLKQIDDIDLSQLRRALDKQAIILAINNFYSEIARLSTTFRRQTGRK